jgi:hypothetical protein
MKGRAIFALAATTSWLLVFVNGRWLEARAEFSQRGSNALSKETQTILDGSEKFILISIDPTPLTEEQKADKRETFHRQPMLGQMEIKDAKLRKRLLTGLYAAADEYRKPGVFGLAPSCFNPRHGIKGYRNEYD